MNENYKHPAMPKGVEEGILKGIYRFRQGGKGRLRVQLLGSGTILREVIAAAELLEHDFEIPADIWSVTSFNELRRDGLDTDRWNLLNPEQEPRTPYMAQALGQVDGPFVAATDYMKTYADQVRNWIPGRYVVMGTDGYGRSDCREALRQFFEVNRYYIAIAALKALFEEGKVDRDTLTKAMRRYKIDVEKPNPNSV